MSDLNLDNNNKHYNNNKHNNNNNSKKWSNLIIYVLVWMFVLNLILIMNILLSWNLESQARDLYLDNQKTYNNIKILKSILDWKDIKVEKK